MMMISTFDFEAWQKGLDPNDPSAQGTAPEGTNVDEAELMWGEVKKQLDGGGDKSEGVKVAVRCRPFNSREKKLNAKLCCVMDRDQVARFFSRLLKGRHTRQHTS